MYLRQISDQRKDSKVNVQIGLVFTFYIALIVLLKRTDFWLFISIGAGPDFEHSLHSVRQ